MKKPKVIKEVNVGATVTGQIGNVGVTGMLGVDNRVNYRRLKVDSCANCRFVEQTCEKYADLICSKNSWWCPVGSVFICDLHKKRK
jgi:hypothetical protein